MPHVMEKRIEKINLVLGGKLCKEKEILFLEVGGPWTFKYSPNKEHYGKCARVMCGKQGLIGNIQCVCKEVRYCSEKCLE